MHPRFFMTMFRNSRYWAIWIKSTPPHVIFPYHLYLCLQPISSYIT